ncbi:three-helix bundle dimerization domain-containing protein [Amycolatopsis sp. PS_44_ISF1]|uniref:three-helix bundle dimerization domain-containing protein n=1 Tax=Amycolatopsis sp. PS_44_ISF1 TaxID=2974917 RepID=UPI0028DF8991|nr:hypothetical protein [Amycolatopsis sp. PS_44_ISF1]MDT8912047.1 hypothetical protein [Amycolatopsis sp. PS_44_ISF1]
MTQQIGMDELTAREEDFGFDALVARLVEEYGEGRRRDIERVVTAERERLSGAEVRSFLPVLAERAARDHLEMTSA